MTAANNAVPARAGTLKRRLADHPFFRGWEAMQFRSIENHSVLLTVPAGGRVLDIDDVQPYDYFLLRGRLRLRARGQPERQVTAADREAEYPIAHLRPSRFQVDAVEVCELLRIESSLLKRVAGAHRPRRSRFVDSSATLGGSWRGHDLVVAVQRGLDRGDLEVPAVPGIAIKVRRALSQERVTAAELATVISADPVIAGRLLKLANSALFVGAAGPCNRLQDALMRLGFERTQRLVFSLATCNLFHTDEPVLKERLLLRWRHAIDMAALCAVLSALAGGLSADTGLLVGLLHEIGAIAILRLAGDYRDLADAPGQLDDILEALTPEVSAAVLEQWGFDGAFRHAARRQNDWLADHGEAPCYADVLVLAHLHALVKQRQFERLPRIDETPAFHKLEVGPLSAGQSLQVLEDARQQLQALRELLA